jgi:hypothetical protein
MEAALDALLARFPNQVVIGFEELWDTRPDSEPEPDLGPPDASLERALERIGHLNPAYKVRLQGHGLVHVYPAHGTADPSHLLDIRLKIFHLPPDRCIQYAIENLDWYRGGMVGGYAPELSEFLLKSERNWYRKHGKQPPGGGAIGGEIGGCLPPRAAGAAGSSASTVRRNITVREAMNLMAIRSLELSRGKVQTNDPGYGGHKPISWKFRFRRESDADTGLGGVAVFQTF